MALRVKINQQESMFGRTHRQLGMCSARLFIARDFTMCKCFFGGMCQPKQSLAQTRQCRIRTFPVQGIAPRKAEHQWELSRLHSTGSG